MPKNHLSIIEWAPRRSPLALAVLATLLAQGSVHAAELSIDNPDVAIRLDTTVRYNLGVRLQNVNPKWGNNSAFDESDYAFSKRGDVITNRVDLFSEFDLTFKKNYGLRVSAAVWGDAAYSDRGSQNPAFGSNTSYPNNEYTNYVKRFYSGPSGEFLDAFAYGKFDLGGAMTDVKVGRHAILWGESLFGNTHGISNSQAPNDGRKGLSSPGASAKETALPIGQISVQSQVTDTMLVGFQYLYEWRSNRLPEGGTLFGAADSVLDGPPRVSPTIGRGVPEEGGKGDFGVMVRMRPDWLNGTLGFYYRQYDEKNPWAAQLARNPTRTLPVYAKNLELYGVSIAKEVGGVSVGAEFSYRKNGALSSAGAMGPRYEGAIGDTMHGLVNAIYFLPKLSWYDTANLSAELSWNHLAKVSQNAAVFKAAGYSAACTAATDRIAAGCASENAYGLGLSFTPTWSQVQPGLDLSMPIFLNLGLSGNAASNSGGNQGFNTYKIGLSAIYRAVHQFDFAVMGWSVKSLPAAVNAGALPGAANPNGAAYSDKAFAQFTYNYQF